jgi:hypothetical protein
MIKHSTKIITVSAAGILAACGMKLLWEARYEASYPKAVQALFLDSEGSSYVGVSRANAAIDDFSAGNEVEHHGLLLKYDSNGSLAWSLAVPAGEGVVAIEHINNDVISIASGFSQHNKEGGVWLVSTETGEIIQELTRYEGGTSSESFKKMIAHDGQLYIASSTECTETRCSGALDHSKMEVFDFSGNPTNSKVNNAAIISDFDIANNGAISVALVGQQGELQQLDANLNLQWSTSNNAVTAREMQYCRVENVRFVGDSHVVACNASALKLDNEGALLWSSSFNSLLNAKRDHLGEIVAEDAWSGASRLEVDAEGNIYLAKSRVTYYMGDEDAPRKLGNIDLYAPLTLESDAVIIKLDGAAGGILWSDDINTSIAIRNTDFTSYFYSPVALHVSGGQALLTTQAIAGTYTGYGSPESSLYCFGYPGMNGCPLVEFKERYAKTFVFSASNGQRLGSTRHNMPYARVSELDSTGNLLVAGDMQPIYFSSWPNVLALGPVIGTEPYLIGLLTRSDVILQKYKR